MKYVLKIKFIQQVGTIQQIKEFSLGLLHFLLVIRL